MSPVLHVEESQTLQGTVVVGRRRTGYWFSITVLVDFVAFYLSAVFFSLLLFPASGDKKVLSVLPKLRLEGLFACSCPDCLR
jgi:hypothetical protein